MPAFILRLDSWRSLSGDATRQHLALCWESIIAATGRVVLLGHTNVKPGQKICNQTFELHFRVRLISDLHGLSSYG